MYAQTYASSSSSSRFSAAAPTARLSTAARRRRATPGAIPHDQRRVERDEQLARVPRSDPGDDLVVGAETPGVEHAPVVDDADARAVARAPREIDADHSHGWSPNR